MSLMISNKRIILFIALITVILGNAVWYHRTNPRDVPVDFTSAPTLHIAILDHAEAEALPYFDKETGTWIKDGEVIRNIALSAVDSDPEGIGDDSIGHFVLIKVGPTANAATYVDSIKNLAASGVCNVGVYQENGSSIVDGQVEIEIFEIVAVKQELAEVYKCRNET
jgi:hypothetical protein